jgi:death-on-curing protein
MTLIDQAEFARAAARGFTPPPPEGRGQDAGEPVWLDADAVAARYTGILRAGADLAAAIWRPRWAYALGRERDIGRLAGQLLVSVTRAHALIDGNKRASVVLCEEFLAVNGLRLADDEDALYAIAMTAAAGAEEEQVLGPLSALVRAGAPAQPIDRRLPGLMHRLASA